MNDKKVMVMTKHEVELVEYWAIRGVQLNGEKKQVVAEMEIYIEPNELIIAQFLADYPNVAFCTVEHNYKLKK